MYPGWLGWERKNAAPPARLPARPPPARPPARPRSRPPARPPAFLPDARLPAAWVQEVKQVNPNGMIHKNQIEKLTCYLCELLVSRDFAYLYVLRV